VNGSEFYTVEIGVVHGCRQKSGSGSVVSHVSNAAGSVGEELSVDNQSDRNDQNGIGYQCDIVRSKNWIIGTSLRFSHGKMCDCIVLLTLFVDS
jgi:hypothetical protein